MTRTRSSRVMAPALLITALAGVPHGAIDFDVTPETTEVYVDGTMRGQVDDFDGHPEKLYLRAGTHLIALKTPDGQKVNRKVRIVAGHEMNLKLDLEGEEDETGADGS